MDSAPSTDEVSKFISMARGLSAAPILDLLIHTIGSQGDLTHRISRLKPAGTGRMRVSFNEIPEILNICLKIVHRDYVTDVMVPHEDYAADLSKQYELLKGLAKAYWRQFREDNAQLIRDIESMGINIDSLTVSENGTTLYFSADTPQRIGIVCYYTEDVQN